MSRKSRKAIDILVRHAFRIISFFSVIALVAMLGFVFYQGIVPFHSPTADSIHVIPESIDAITVNGTLYRNHRRYIPVDLDADILRISFENRGEVVDIAIGLSAHLSDPDKRIGFPPELEERLQSTELDSYTLTWPGALPGTHQRVHINLPEPPYNFFSFLFGSEWRPVHRKLFGIFPMIAATIFSTLGAVMLGVPIALFSSVYIAEYLSSGKAILVRSAIDLLAGIPSVVYGFFGLMIIVPFVQYAFGSASGSSLLSAIIVLSIMILPTVVAISMTSLKAVPDTYREASLAVGASKMQTSWFIVFPAARSGIIASIVLGTARALGETMAVILVAGNSPQFPRVLTDSVRTMTATIALEMGYSSGRHNEMLFSVGIILFAMIFILNGFIMKLQQRIARAEQSG